MTAMNKFDELVFFALDQLLYNNYFRRLYKMLLLDIYLI